MTNGISYFSKKPTVRSRFLMWVAVSRRARGYEGRLHPEEALSVVRGRLLAPLELSEVRIGPA